MTTIKIEQQICNMLGIKRESENFVKMVAKIQGHIVVLDALGNFNVDDGYMETKDPLEVTRYIAERQIERMVSNG